MYDSSAGLLIDVFNSMDILTVIFARVIGFLIILPVFSGGYVNTQVKIGFSIILTYIIYINQWSNVFYLQMPTDTVLAFAIVLFKEFIVGYTLGFSVYIFMTVFYFAGQIMDYQIGFSMVNIFDAMSQMQVPVTGNIMYFIMSMFLIQTGALNYLLLSFFESYSIVPITTANILSNPALPHLFLDTIARFFVLGLRIAIPLSGTIILIDFTLGILVKAVPQMNVFVVGLPIKLLVGLVVFYLIMPTYTQIFKYVFNDIVELFRLVLKGMVYNVP